MVQSGATGPTALSSPRLNALKGETVSELPESPDGSAFGLTSPVDAKRYDGATYDPREVTGLMHAMMPSGVRVLDVGCGTGLVTHFANLDRDNEVVAIEPDAVRARVARERGLNVLNAVLGDELQQELGKFDVVMSSDVLEHVASPHDFISTLKASLKPTGHLLLSVPNVAHWSVRWMVLRGKFDYEPTGIMDATHLRWFTAESLARLLRTEGFDVVEMTQTVGTWMPVNLRGFLKHVPGGIRRRAFVAATLLMPKLFGIQHVVKARLRET